MAISTNKGTFTSRADLRIKLSAPRVLAEGLFHSFLHFFQLLAFQTVLVSSSFSHTYLPRTRLCLQIPPAFHGVRSGILLPASKRRPIERTTARDRMSSSPPPSKQSADAATLALLGKTQVLKRRFGLLTLFAFAVCELITWLVNTSVRGKKTPALTKQRQGDRFGHFFASF